MIYCLDYRSGVRIVCNSDIISMLLFLIFLMIVIFLLFKNENSVWKLIWLIGLLLSFAKWRVQRVVLVVFLIETWRVFVSNRNLSFEQVLLLSMCCLCLFLTCSFLCWCSATVGFFYANFDQQSVRSPSVIVIGGGMAGIAAARALHDASFQVFKRIM